MELFFKSSLPLPLIRLFAWTRYLLLILSIIQREGRYTCTYKQKTCSVLNIILGQVEYIIIEVFKWTKT